MGVTKEIEELKKYAKDFAEIKDPKTMLAQNKKLFMHKWIKVLQYYNYTIKRVEPFSDEFHEIIETVLEISDENAELEEWAMAIIDPQREKKQKNKDDEISIQSLVNQIESLVSEIKNMQKWDPEEISDIEWQLQKCQNELISNKDSVELQYYQSLMNDINLTLNKISKFNDLINSDVIESINKI